MPILIIREDAEEIDIPYMAYEAIFTQDSKMKRVTSKFIQKLLYFQ